MSVPSKASGELSCSLISVGLTDVLITAIGKAQSINAAMVRPGAVVIDVGINTTLEG